MAKTFTLSDSQSQQLAEREEKYWLESEEYKRAEKANRRFLPLFIVGAALMLGAGLYSTRSGLTKHEFLAAGILSFAGILIILITASMHYGRWVLDREKVVSRFRSSLLFDLNAADAAASTRDPAAAETEKSDLDARIENNQARLEVYHKIATDQAKKSFRSGQIAMAIGLGLVLTLGIVASVSSTTRGGGNRRVGRRDQCGR